MSSKSIIQSDNVEAHERDFRWECQPCDGKTVSFKCVAIVGPLGATYKNDAAGKSDCCSDQTHWLYSKCAKNKAPRRKIKKKVPDEAGAGASAQPSEETVDAGVDFDIFSGSAPAVNLPNVVGIESVTSCESWLDSVVSEKLPFCSKVFANCKKFPKPAEDVVSAALVSSILFSAIPWHTLHESFTRFPWGMDRDGVSLGWQKHFCN